jgi:peroxiredoxin
MTSRKTAVVVVIAFAMVSLLVFINCGKGLDKGNGNKSGNTQGESENLLYGQTEDGGETGEGRDADEGNKSGEVQTEEPQRTEASDFVLKTISGGEVKLSDHKGKVVILDFWDTWCAPCKVEIPGFVKLQDEWGDNGVQIIGIAFAKQGVHAVKAFAEDYHINYPVGICDQSTFENYGPITGIPTTFVIDKKGRIYEEYVGYRPEEVFVNDIKKLIVE